MKDFIVKNKYLILFILAFLVLYLVTAAHTVQSGDTGELVTNSYFLRVSHPPGYPLFSLLYHLPLRYLSFSNPFHTASLFTIFITLCWFSILGIYFRDKNSILVLSVLASSLMVWRYALLPDVFSLHSLFLVLVFLVFVNPALLEKKLIIFLISLSVANHHTILFVFPLFAYAFLQNPNKKTLIFCLIFGAFSFCIYFLLIFFNTEDYGSWGHIGDIKSVIHHFLRNDYGTFSLLIEQSDDTPWFGFFSFKFFEEAWSILILFIYLLFTQRKTFLCEWKRLAILTFSIICYLLIFNIMGKINLKGEPEIIFERFLIQPFILSFFIIIFVLKLAKPHIPKLILLSIMINIGFNIVKNFGSNNYRKNTYIEDHLFNALNVIPVNGTYFTSGDTYGFGTYYLKDVLKIRPDISHVHSTWDFEWSRIKTNKRYPYLFLNEKISFIDNFNFAKGRLFTNYPPRSLSFYATKNAFRKSYRGLVYEIFQPNATNQGVQFDCDHTYKWRNRPGLEEYSNFDIGLVYDLKYGECFLAKTTEFLKFREFEKAEEAIINALKLSPYNTVYQNILCKIYRVKNDPKLEGCKSKLFNMLEVINPKYFEF